MDIHQGWPPPQRKKPRHGETGAAFENKLSRPNATPRPNSKQGLNDCDAKHERRIRACYEKWLEGDATWQELTALISQRSPAQVAAMECVRGLQ